MKKIADRHLPFPRVRHANRIQITTATGGRSRRFDRRACCRDQNIDPELNELLSQLRQRFRFAARGNQGAVTLAVWSSFPCTRVATH